MQNGLHHHHIRMRKLNEESASPRVAALDRMIWIVAFLGPFSTIPQIFQVWVFGETTGVSAVSWSAYALFSFVWLAYALVHKQRVLVMSSSLWIVANGLVALGVLIY